MLHRIVQKLAISVLAVIGVALVPVAAQPDADGALAEQMQTLFPELSHFSEKEGDPPHYRVLGAAGADGEPQLLGLAFWTTELDPLERGFDGPIKMLVGMDTAGVLAGIVVTEHREPYGYFSVDLAEFSEQFESKNVRDRFRVGDDVDAITRATITVTSASRAIRNSARRIARAYLTPPSE